MRAGAGTRGGCPAAAGWSGAPLWFGARRGGEHRGAQRPGAHRRRGHAAAHRGGGALLRVPQGPDRPAELHRPLPVLRADSLSRPDGVHRELHPRALPGGAERGGVPGAHQGAAREDPAERGPEHRGRVPGFHGSDAMDSEGCGEKKEICRRSTGACSIPSATSAKAVEIHRK